MLPYRDPSYLLLDTPFGLKNNDGFPALSSPQLKPPSPAHFLYYDENLMSHADLFTDNFTPLQLERDQEANTSKKTTETDTSTEPISRKKKGVQAAGEGGKQRSLRTDRHSKIHTAQGLRDRRMRLSLEVARKFFSLQDLLGFDKASATVDWLITHSRSAIEQHLIHLASATNVDAQDAPVIAYSGKKSDSTKKHPLKEKDVSSRSVLTRESRAEARARARERTREKKRMLVDVDNGDGGNFNSSEDLIYNSIEKDEWPAGEVPQTPDCLQMAMDGESDKLANGSYYQYSKDYSMVTKNEERVNFFNEQLNDGNFSGEFEVYSYNPARPAA
ncbi:uncharacterized protein A4U43_C06F16040 [Asparagus officinalis]|uniref:TCP domain-containing protein n=1 Tax=Asparagus officinalis TaxID=4686 RepID=A0A5P1ERD4_ASPOF|nr:transcription factor TCP12-like [Asparagus officinalis]ONK67131.1 uncharacterized protein A4U43_C06F16040 [Asparagus officinalis]